MKKDPIQRLKNAKRRADLRDADKVEAALSAPVAAEYARPPQAQRETVAARRLAKMGD